MNSNRIAIRPFIKADKTIWPKIHETVKLADFVCVYGDVTIGEQANIWCNTVLRGDGNRIEIGRRSNVQDLSCIHITNDSPSILGNDVTVGHQALIHGATIGNNSLVGFKAVVMDKVEVGENCIIGANALIPSGVVIPDNSLVIGFPAKLPKRAVTELEIYDNLKRRVPEYMQFANGFNLPTIKELIEDENDITGVVIQREDK